jgi:hypothetical protein
LEDYLDVGMHTESRVMPRGLSWTSRLGRVTITKSENSKEKNSRENSIAWTSWTWDELRSLCLFSGNSANSKALCVWKGFYQYYQYNYYH